MGDRSNYAIIILVIIGLVVFLGPVIDSESLSQSGFMGIPWLYYYITFFWLLFIYLIYRISKRYKIE